MALITCAGAGVLEGAVHLVGRGAWWSRMRLDTPEAPTGKITIAADGGFSLSGFVLAGFAFCDVAHVQIVGGAGGLATILTPAAYENAQLRDPLEAIMNMSGEAVSSSIDESLLSAQLATWTIIGSTAARALDELCGAAAAALGQAITRRVLEDGTVWVGAESWPSKEMPIGSDVLDVSPSEGRYVLGVESPWLLPGVDLAGVGKVAAVDHWITPNEVRSWAWV